ncbi:MAG: hypothetical protein ABEH64_09345 [Salinirussus sp.]
MTETTTPLEAAFDDPSNPTQVTLYPPDGECRTTCWLTADIDTAVDLAGMA